MSRSTLHMLSNVSRDNHTQFLITRLVQLVACLSCKNCQHVASVAMRNDVSAKQDASLERWGRLLPACTVPFMRVTFVGLGQHNCCSIAVAH